MCGETMRIRTREDAARIPGTAETHIRPSREWACPECDYFEEAAEDDR
jgi:hypothetical protein